MPVQYTSRQLSERVEIESHKRPNRFRRRTWWAAFWLSAACVAWLAYEGAHGEYHIFEGGDVAHVHRMFENDCAKCHTTWAPLKRAMNLDFSHAVYSVDNNACLACHPGSVHHKNQIPAHENISCAECHLEHKGNHSLVKVGDHVCSRCHENIETSDDQKSFVASVTEFGREGGHPEFAFARLLDSKSSDTPGIGTKHEVLQLLRFDEKAGWQDRANIRFNHSAHLKSERDESGNLVYGLIGQDQRLSEERFTDLSQTCHACHQKDSEGKYMLPIRFEQHCQKCHPLLFDNTDFPGQQVPHELPGIVRGFLTDKYTLAAVRNPAAVENEQPARSIPGRKSRPLLSKDQAGWLAEQLNSAEIETLRHTHSMFGPEAKGGCAYCHTVESQDEPAAWKIVPPNIPDRWEPHAIFSHEAHQMMNCVECHGAVDQSKATGDVMLPRMELCRKCHSRHPEQPPAGEPSRHFGAGNDCVECHVYHDHGEDRFIGTLDSLLGAAKTNPDAILKDRNTNLKHTE
jgi:hypothetical protein